MKIILTTSEVVEILLRHFPGQNLSATDIEIESPVFETKPCETKPCETKVCEMAAWARARARADNYGSERISCIKWLRDEIPGLSLSDAKTAIEISHQRVVGFFSRNGTLTGIFSITR